jgi:hypothetical protein
MKLKDITDVLTFAAFRPEPDDSTAAWSKRFPKQRTLMLNIGREGIQWAGRDRSGTITESNFVKGDIKELAQEMADEWKAVTEDGWCAISLNHRFVISLEANLTRKKGTEVLIRTNPKAALGAKAEKGKRYSVENNPESNSSLLLAVDEDFVRQIETTLDPAGFKIGRIACGPYAMLMDSLDQVAEARAQYKAANGDASLGKIINVICCGGSVAALTHTDEQWLELRSRSNLYTMEDLEPLVKILSPLVENAGPGAQIIFMADEAGTGIAEFLQQALPENRVSDLSQPNQLWKILTD